MNWGGNSGYGRWSGRNGCSALSGACGVRRGVGARRLGAGWDCRHCWAGGGVGRGCHRDRRPYCKIGWAGGAGRRRRRGRGRGRKWYSGGIRGNGSRGSCRRSCPASPRRLRRQPQAGRPQNLPPATAHLKKDMQRLGIHRLQRRQMQHALRTILIDRHIQPAKDRIHAQPGPLEHIRRRQPHLQIRQVRCSEIDQFNIGSQLLSDMGFHRHIPQFRPGSRQGNSRHQQGRNKEAQHNRSKVSRTQRL